MKHKNYDVIVAWAQGKPIQVKSMRGEHIWIDYQPDLRYSPNFNDDLVEWRIKPETKKLSYRVALMKTQYPDIFFTVSVNTDCDSSVVENKDFVKWVTDWLEYEFE